MVASWVIELGVVASVLSLLSLQPLVYRFLFAWWRPYSVEFQRLFFAASPGWAQAGMPTQLRITIRNRTQDAAFFSFGMFWPKHPVGEPFPVLYETFRDFPLIERFSGHLKVGPLERLIAVMALTPIRRGEFTFEVQVVEVFHMVKYPNWRTFQTRVLRIEHPRLHPRVFRASLRFSVSSWAVARDNLKSYIGRDLTKEELALDDAYQAG